MPFATRNAPYDRQFAASSPGPVSAAATPAPVFTANSVTGIINLSSTVTIANASDAEFCTSSIYALVGHPFDIPQFPANPVMINARFNPCVGTHTRTITDEFGFSSLTLGATMHALCYISVPNLGWIAPAPRIRAFADINPATHTAGPPGPVPARGRFGANWNIATPAGGYPNGLFCWVGLWVTQQVNCDDVTVTTATTLKGTVQQIRVNF